MTSPYDARNALPPAPRSIQLELFETRDQSGARPAVSIPREIARASVSPGWWPLIAPLYYAMRGARDLRLDVCREENARLKLQATSGPAPNGDEEIEDVLARIRDQAAQTCGVCGRRGARPCCTGPGDVRVVCDDCRRRLANGEAYLQIADEYWRLDGSRRPRDLVTVSRPSSDEPGSDTANVNSFDPLDGAEMTRIYQEIRGRVASRVVGLEDQVSRISLLGALHVGAGLTRAPRALILGPSGSGKNTLISALQFALEPFQLPWILVTGLSLTAPGWGGAPSIGSVLQDALQDKTQSSAERACIVIDELHHVCLEPGVSGVTKSHRRDVLGSLLEVAGGGVIRLGEGTTEYSCQHALVIAMGAFTDLVDLTTSRAIGTRELLRAGLPLELVSRLTEELIVIPRPGADAMKEILRRWPPLTSLVDVCKRMGYAVRIPEESYGRAARVVSLGYDGSTLRTAGGWLVTALRGALIVALNAGEPCELVIAPDALPIEPAALRRPPDDPPNSAGEWDATIVLPPR